jgi:hypothetical protein
VECPSEGNIVDTGEITAVDAADVEGGSLGTELSRLSLKLTADSGALIPSSCASSLPSRRCRSSFDSRDRRESSLSDVRRLELPRADTVPEPRCTVLECKTGSVLA